MPLLRRKQYKVMAVGYSIRAKGAENTPGQAGNQAAVRLLSTQSCREVVRGSPHRPEVEGNEEKEDHDAGNLPVPRAQLELAVLQQRKTQEVSVVQGLPSHPLQGQRRPTSASRASSRRRRAAFSLRSCWLSASTACSLASRPCRYSFFLRRDWQADSLFLIIRCCRFNSFALHQGGRNKDELERDHAEPQGLCYPQLMTTLLPP